MHGIVAFILARFLSPLRNAVDGIAAAHYRQLNRWHRRRLMRQARREATRLMASARARYDFANGVYAMGTTAHTDIASGAAANAAIFNSPLGELDDAIYRQKYDIKSRQYGAVLDGVTDDTAKVQAAIDAAKAIGGGRILIPGLCFCSTALNLDGANGIILEGLNGVQSANPRSRLIYGGGAGAANFVKATSTFGCEIRNLYVTNSLTAFNGFLLDLDHGVPATDSAYAHVADCLFSISGTVGKHVNLNRAINISFTDTYFSGGAQATSATNYANAISWARCRFQNFTGVPVQATTGQGWKLDSCTWEPLVSGQAGAISVSGINGLGVLGGWMGDVTGTASSWITFSGNGLDLGGGLFISGNAAATGVTVSGSSNFGIRIAGVEFANLSVGAAIGSAVNDFVFIHSNSYATVTSPVTGTPKSGVVNVSTPNVMIYGNIVAGGAAPAVSAINAGISGTPTVTGHNNGFYIDFATTGTPPGASAKLFTLTYSVAFPAIPSVTLTSGGLAVGGPFIVAAGAAASFDVYCVAAMAISSNYRIYVTVVGI